ncbi:MAG: DEAD/DEAH box helicase family protein [Clostridia bacterium]|nr:DEAD/DEAH box helicase family protein [Clostridia bacterium]
MVNFEFLKSKKEFIAFADACIEAEKSIATSPSLCALGCRKSAELAVKWLYSVDKSLKLPYNDNLAALIYNPSFADSIDDKDMGKLKYIIKLGNHAAHTNQNITYREAVLALGNLFDFIQFIDYCYGTDYKERSFDEKLLSPENTTPISRSEFDDLKNDLDEKTNEREKLLDEVKRLQAEMEALKIKNKTSRTFSPKPISEAETRRSIINIDLESMGWILGQNCIAEVPVVGMPISSRNPDGNGKVDYVLYGDNGKPLAVVEAKRTSREPKEGKQQAKEYADCIEKMTGQRPLIFYTNGYETWFWDDSYYPERPVYSVFTKEDMQRIVNRRDMRKPFDRVEIKDEITDRPYQKIAIQRVCKDFSDSRRKALLVMATGTGKTRTVVSLVDVLSNYNWVTNILVLADRKELVKQAKQAFNRHMPNLSTCNLLKREKDEKPTDRAIFSTYQTIMNAINDEKTDDGKKLFTPAHFDLIIVDEAHRSIFKKYRAIFKYFDALVVGLTATPRSDVDRSTYDFFDLEKDMPTYAYEYDTAVSDGYLCDYHCIEKLFKIPVQGITKEDLSEEEQQSFEDSFEEGEEIPDYITGEEINKVFFNINTCRQVLTDVMQKGLKVEGGDKLGKTIIFARNHAHALFIEEQFNALYPQYRGEFARVIDNYEERAETLLDNFKQKDKYPQIAISVDMLDTGVDVPEILNLVYFKRVLSKIKFWQMFGRGTRLCEDLFGAGENKKKFYVFDYLGNFEFFRQDPKGKESTETGSLTEQTFKLKAQIVFNLQDGKFSEDEYSSFRSELVDEISSQVSVLNREQFQVKQNLQFVEKYSDKQSFMCLTTAETEELISHLANLMPASDDEESARRFDLLMYRYMLANVSNDDSVMRSVVNRIKGIAAVLETKATLPDVKNNMGLIRRIQQDDFWSGATLKELDMVRLTIRDLMYCLKNEMKKKIINITDSVLLEKEGERFTADNSLENYYRRASRYVDEHSNCPSIQKLKNNQPLLNADWEELEQIFWHEVGTQEEYNREANGASLGRFVRALTGLSKEATNNAFSDFLNTALYSEEQICMVQYIIEALENQGTLQPDEMKDIEFFGGLDVFEVWGHDNKINDWRRIQEAIQSVNKNAEKTAA